MNSELRSLVRGMMLILSIGIAVILIPQLPLFYDRTKELGPIEDLRGHMRMVIRDSRIQDQQVVINIDGRSALHTVGPTGRGGAELTISDSLRNDILALMEEWCANSPTYRFVGWSNPYYRVAWKCVAWPHITNIPLEDLPQPLAKLLHQVAWPP